ncbi:HD domain-containing protein [Halostella salina]|uniref:HD domain-containing protein n=1 Tax=Halostella salina TaxID=1547897 RepID=UPI000EF79148|nr:HD domain-containing protein [Halostella salina]
MSSKQFKDPVHGYVEVAEPIVERIVDTPSFQRQRHVRQLSATYLVYPGANHTRFEHALGVFALAKRVFRSLRSQRRFARGASEDHLDAVEDTLTCAALLHDIGHPPLSHLGEHHLDAAGLRERLADAGLVGAFEDAGIEVGEPDGPFRRASPHELLSCVVVLTKYADALRALGVDPYEVCSYILGYSLSYEREGDRHFGVAAEVLHSPIDVDRLDYIIRDSRMTGAEVLSIDTERMIDAYTAVPDAGLALRDKALSTVGNYLEGRVALYMWVTQHHKAVYANVLLRELLDEFVELADERPITADKVLEGYVDDYYAMERIRAAAREHPDSVLADLHDRFRARRFPESCWKHGVGYDESVDVTDDMAAFSEWLLRNADALEADLAATLDRPEHEVWIERSYVPEYEPGELMDIPIAHRDSTRSVAETGLYGDRAFENAIPFVFVPDGDRWAAIDHLNAEFARAQAAEPR